MPLKVGKEVHLKIQELCSRISDVEWSGILFYQIEGELHEKTAKIELKDILPMDKGSGSYTSFKSDERFAEFMSSKMEEHGTEEVLSWKQGLIHSHNDMRVFFSGTDQKELYSQCEHYSQYLSFICNNKMEFVARVAQPAKGEQSKIRIPLSIENSKGKKVIHTEKHISVSTSLILSYECDIESESSLYTKDKTFMEFLNRLFKSPVKKSTQNSLFDYPEKKDFFNPKMNKPQRWWPEEEEEEKGALDNFFIASKLDEYLIDTQIVSNEKELEQVKEEWDIEMIFDIYKEAVEKESPELVAKDFKANIISKIINKKTPTEEILEVVQDLCFTVEMCNIEDFPQLDAIYKVLEKWENMLNNVIKSKKHGRRKFKI